MSDISDIFPFPCIKLFLSLPCLFQKEEAPFLFFPSYFLVHSGFIEDIFFFSYLSIFTSFYLLRFGWKKKIAPTYPAEGSDDKASPATFYHTCCCLTRCERSLVPACLEGLRHPRGMKRKAHPFIISLLTPKTPRKVKVSAW